MTRDEITRIARGAGWPDSLIAPIIMAKLGEFAALVEQHLIKSGYRKCAEGQGDSQFCGLLERAVLDEREACAKACDELSRAHPSAELVAQVCATAIRARSKA